MINSLKYVSGTFLKILFLYLYRDIIQRVADVMLIFGFMHICDAIAV